MPTIIGIDEAKPILDLVEFAKPKISLVDNAKPQLGLVDRATESRVWTRSVSQGSPMGLLLAITYSADETFNTSYRP